MQQTRNKANYASIPFNGIRRAMVTATPSAPRTRASYRSVAHRRSHLITCHGPRGDHRPPCRPFSANSAFSTITIGWSSRRFQISYTIFNIPSGWFGDRIGPRQALTIIVTWWSAFTALTAMTFSATSMIVCRFLFGLGGSGAFPIATRSLSNWMLPTERGWARGCHPRWLRLGGAVTPVIVAAIIAVWGWRAPFLIFALFGLLWGLVWFIYFHLRPRPDEHGSVDQAERDMIRAALNRKERASHECRGSRS